MRYSAPLPHNIIKKILKKKKKNSKYMFCIKESQNAFPINYTNILFILNILIKL